ncbi:hypothetical protein STEG23_015994, partial [Scotinomys teguina]
LQSHDYQYKEPYPHYYLSLMSYNFGTSDTEDCQENLVEIKTEGSRQHKGSASIGKLICSHHSTVGHPHLQYKPHRQRFLLTAFEGQGLLSRLLGNAKSTIFGNGKTPYKSLDNHDLSESHTRFKVFHSKCETPD